jgi:hypothetical protein
VKVESKVHKRQQGDNSDAERMEIRLWPSANGVFLGIKRRVVEAFVSTKIGKHSLHRFCHARRRQNHSRAGCDQNPDAFPQKNAQSPPSPGHSVWIPAVAEMTNSHSLLTMLRFQKNVTNNYLLEPPFNWG